MMNMKKSIKVSTKGKLTFNLIFCADLSVFWLDINRK